MEFSFTADTDGQLVKRFLRRFGVSKSLLARVKFEGGEIFVNGREQNAIYPLKVGDRVKIVVADESANPELFAEDFPLDIVYEDAHYLVINKPAGVPSITGREKPTGSMSNFVAGYLKRTHQPNQTVHIVTRLDRGTSGLMLFAKHKYAHALMMTDKERLSFRKQYFALIQIDSSFPLVGNIEAPIGRREGSIIERCVRFDGLMEAKEACTSYTTVQETNNFRLLDVTLHTGRTHQIRVHFAYKGYPLIGDELYGGDHTLIDRQALHCHHLKFHNFFTNERIDLESSLPNDIAQLLK